MPMDNMASMKATLERDGAALRSWQNQKQQATRRAVRQAGAVGMILAPTGRDTFPKHHKARPKSVGHSLMAG